LIFQLPDRKHCHGDFRGELLKKFPTPLKTFNAFFILIKTVTALPQTLIGGNIFEIVYPHSADRNLIGHLFTPVVFFCGELLKKFPTPLKTLKKSLGNVKEGLCVFCVAVCVRRGMVKTIPYKNRCATPCHQLWNEAGTSLLTPKHTFQEVLKGFGETFSKVSPKTHPRSPASP
jgi:hypothetical protein